MGKKTLIFVPSCAVLGAFGLAVVSIIIGTCQLYDIELYTYPRSSGAKAAGKETMRAAVFQRYGNTWTAGLEIRDNVPVPDYRSKDVLVKVHAASVNPIDWKMMGGYLEFLPDWIKKKPPMAPIGQDLAGTVVAVGDDVHRFHPGDEVFATMNFLRPGAFAEYAVLREDLVAKKPKNTNWHQAAGFPLAAQAALQALRDGAKCCKEEGTKWGMRVLIIGGSTAVGWNAGKIAQWLGAKIVAATAKKDKIKLVQKLNLHKVVDAEKELERDLERIINLHDRHLSGFDKVIDTVGGDNLFTIGMRAARNFNGTFLTLVGDENAVGVDDVAPFSLQTFVDQYWKTIVLWYKRWQSIGRNKQYKVFVVRPKGKDLNLIRHLVEDRILTPYMDKTYPLAKLGDALRHSAAGHASGKIIIDILDTSAGTKDQDDE